MTATDLLEKIGDTLGSTATVKSVFGDAIRINGKTVVPIAKVAYGFGGGFGTGKGSPDREGEGGGGGGGVRAFPVGALEITEGNTRFVPFIDVERLVPRLAAAVVVSAVLGGMILRRR